MTNNLGFIGLGVMGSPMARHLYEEGYKVSVFNRSSEKLNIWISHCKKATKAKSVIEIAEKSNVIILCIGNDDDVRNTINEMLDALVPGTVVIDHTTTSAELAKEMNTILAEKGCFFLDAPISGGQVGAELGKLSVMVGGDEKIFISIKDILKPYSKFIKYMGPSGHGQLTKMVNQICIAGLIQALAEGIYFSKKAGLEISEVVEAISKGAAQSWHMDNRWESMKEGRYDHGFAVDLMRKDLNIVLDQAKLMGIDLAITDLVDSFYEEIQKMDGGSWDTSSLLKRLES